MYVWFDTPYKFSILDLFSFALLTLFLKVESKGDQILAVTLPLKDGSDYLFYCTWILGRLRFRYRQVLMDSGNLKFGVLSKLVEIISISSMKNLLKNSIVSISQMRSDFFRLNHLFCRSIVIHSKMDNGETNSSIYNCLSESQMYNSKYADC